MFLASPENMMFIASWDTAQMNVDEVDRHCDCMAAIMRRLASETNWDEKIGRLFPPSLGQASGLETA